MCLSGTTIMFDEKQCERESGKDLELINCTAFPNCETALVARHGRPHAPPHHRNEDDIDGFRDLPLLRFFDLL